MRTYRVFVLLLVAAAIALPSRLLASSGARGGQTATPPGSVSGVARRPNQSIASNQTVQLRNVDTGQLAGSTTSSQGGAFSFTGVAPAQYAVELVDATGKVVGVSGTFTVATGAVAGIAVTGSAAMAGTAAAAGGFGVLGLGSATSIAVIGAAGIAGTAVAFKTTRGDASPSR